MSRKLQYLAILLSSLSGQVYSQIDESGLTRSETKGSVSLNYLQLSDSIKESMKVIFPSRDRLEIKIPTALSYEVSGIKYYNEYPWVEAYGVSLAIYSGCTFSFNSLNSSFSGYSPVYHTYNEKPGDSKYSDSFLYFAPGISVFSKNGKFSVDLYKRLESQISIGGFQQKAPYKVRFHF